MPLIPDDEEKAAYSALTWLAAALATVMLIGLLVMTCGCSGAAQNTPVIAPPAVVEVVKLVPVPCPIPQLPQAAQPILPLIDSATAPIKTILEALRIDYIQLWLERQQLRELLMTYVQQAEVRNAEVTP